MSEGVDKGKRKALADLTSRSASSLPGGWVRRTGRTAWKVGRAEATEDGSSGGREVEQRVEGRSWLNKVSGDKMWSEM